MRTALDRWSLLLNGWPSWINVFFFQLSHFKVYRACTRCKMLHLLFEKYVHIYTTQSTVRLGEANWKCSPLLNRITGDHISFFIGHKWRTSVSTRLSFHIKHLNRDCSPISVAPPCLFKPTCASYIKPQKEQRGCFVHERVFLQRFAYRTKFKGVLKFFNVYSMTRFALKWFVYVVRSFKSQLIWQLWKPEPTMSTLDLAFFFLSFFLFLIWSQSPSCVWLLF